MKDVHLHQSHKDIEKRLKRAGGQLKGIIEMMDAGRSCLDIVQQLHAVEKAIGQAKKAMIQDHLDHCLDDLVTPIPREQRSTLDEFREITKYL